ncbi:MAG: hypothetical protein WDN28_19065 [Chthoniobacter sp.]
MAPGQWFGLGLRIAQQAAEELTNSAELRAEALEFFSANQLYRSRSTASPTAASTPDR